ncbi:hypothetical protein CRM90_06995 [Mycobacterium sp. ENV421]|uniref:hypothetical protein n=1 Tax=unclassified Mycobacterium TaxID=2642494 RepID=UPI000C9A0CCD|nr:hypothetical protein [Mycobacterium sp. ENV421]PND58382.1 hypothetical protein CRM90_06995 [Mycobacterium sp. ENV421]
MSTPERSERTDERQPHGDKPVPDENAKAKAKEMMTAYEDRPTAVLPGSDNTVTGTAVNDWLDEEGQPLYGKNEDTDGSS